MRIAMFTDAYAPRVNGVAVSVKSFAQALCSLGHEVCVVCPDYGDENELEKDEMPLVFRIPSDNVPWSKEDRGVRIDQWHRLKKTVDSFNPDVVHINSEFVMGWYGITYARHRHIAVAFTFHTLWEDYLENYLPGIPQIFTKKLGRDFVKFYLKRADEIIVPTTRIANVMHEYGIEKESDVLPTGIPEEVFSFNQEAFKVWKNSLLSEFPGLKGKKILLFVGRVVIEKNVDFLLPVLKNVKEKNSDAVLLFVGDGPHLETLKESVKKECLENSVFFTGYRPREELVFFHHLADVFVFPSLTETQGLVTVEAMLAGLPVVAIGEMGTLDVMQGDNGGFMVKNDLAEFSEKVNLLLSDSALHEKKSLEGKAWGSQWSMGSLVPKLLECYQKAIAIRKKRIQSS